MKIIADSGSTKTDWLVMEGSVVVAQIHTGGMNPYFLTTDELVDVYAESPLKKYASNGLDALPDADVATAGGVDEIWFYGAGCTPGEKTEMVTEALRRVFGLSCAIYVYSDMVGAARALCQQSEGVACILGTGSNSCLYDGHDVVKNVSPLGFILGDEGSGANLGKLLVGNILKDQMGEELKRAFLDETGLTPADIIDRVYRKPLPNRWLASLSPFIVKHLDNEAVRAMVKDAFGAFFDRNIRNYGRPDLPVGMVGSIAWYYQDIIREVADEKGYRIGKIMRTPLDGLQAYHG